MVATPGGIPLGNLQWCSASDIEKINAALIKSQALPIDQILWLNVEVCILNLFLDWSKIKVAALILLAQLQPSS